MEIPLIGLGTWELRGKQCQQVVKLALDIGYRHIDTAFAYENHQDIAQGINGFPRKELFITTKLSLGQATTSVFLSQVNDREIRSSVEKTCDKALKELKTSYLDLFLIHWPERTRPLEKILQAMQSLVEKEKVRYVGVSNYTQSHLQDAYDAHLKVDFNQVEFHPYLFQKNLLEFCKKHGTKLISYRPFGKGKLLEEEPLFAKIGEKYGKTPAQVVLRWIIQKNIPVIPKASSKLHLQENFTIFDFTLTFAEESQINSLNRNYRYASVPWNEFDY